MAKSKKEMIPFNSSKRLLKLLFLATVLVVSVRISYAQPGLPQRTLIVTPTQAIHFGTLFATGSGGTVTVGWDGTRTSSGSITLLSLSPVSQPAIFEIKLCEGRNIHITYDATTNLTGSNGGNLTLDLGPTEKGINGASFAANSDCNFITPVRMGGTLHVPGTTIPGAYSGSFAITFNQE